MATKNGEKMHRREHMLALNGEDIDEKDVSTGTVVQLAMSPQKSKKKSGKRKKS